jgi:hypothetical protein
VSAALGSEWTVVEWAAGCTSCGSPAKCPKWIVTGTLSCQPYPCLCKQTRAQAYEDHGIEDAACWWRDKKRAGQLASRCPCWGRVRDDSLPQDCCSRHEANPQYVIPDPVSFAPGVATKLDEAGEGEPAASVSEGLTDHSEAPARNRTAGATGERAAGSTASYTRLWPASESTCGCPTPWDGEKTAKGHHCCGCHTNWDSPATASVHQRDIRHRCANPLSIVDVDTRRPLLYARDVRGARVWAFIRW